MITNGWVDWAIRDPGPANKVYPGSNAGEGICWHSMEGWYAGSRAELMKPDRAASWQFSLKLDGTLIQHYPVTACCWASGNREANTTLWSVELEGIHSMPINPEQMTKALRLIDEFRPWNKVSRQEPKTMWEHREVALWSPPNAGPTACPSERYAPLWEALASQEDQVTREEYETLLLACFSGKEEMGLSREERLANAVYRAQDTAAGNRTSIGEQAAGGHVHAAPPVAEDHSHVVPQHRTGGVA